MELLEGIKTRRSIRKYTGQVIDDQQIKMLLDAGFSAPSARNIRPWHFVVVRDPARLQEVANAHPYAKMLPSAGCGIVVCGDLSSQELEGYIAQDCSAAIENMLLAAHGMGLGAVWLGVYPRYERVRAIEKIFSLPDNIAPMGLISVGYPAETLDTPDRYMGKNVHYETWE